MYTPVFVIADEDLLAYKSVFKVMRDYAMSERAKVILVGPIDGLGVASKKRRFHTNKEVKSIAIQRMIALSVLNACSGTTSVDL